MPQHVHCEGYCPVNVFLPDGLLPMLRGIVQLKHVQQGWRPLGFLKRGLISHTAAAVFLGVEEGNYFA